MTQFIQDLLLPPNMKSQIKLDVEVTISNDTGCKVTVYSP